MQARRWISIISTGINRGTFQLRLFFDSVIYFVLSCGGSSLSFASEWILWKFCSVPIQILLYLIETKKNSY